jgi:hypothetical protein
VCTLARDFLQEQDFPGRNLLQRASRTLEELLSGAKPENFKLRIYTMKLSAGLLNLVRLSL